MRTVIWRFTRIQIPMRFVSAILTAVTEVVTELQFAVVARMHSSRMRIGRSLTICRALLPGGGCLPQCMLGYPLEQTPPWEQTHPQSRHTPQSRHPPGADAPQSRHPPRADTPREQTPPPVNRMIDMSKTRMHSSRMRTGRSLTVCCSLLPGDVPGLGGSAPGGCLVGGVSGLGGYPSMH